MIAQFWIRDQVVAGSLKRYAGADLLRRGASVRVVAGVEPALDQAEENHYRRQEPWEAGAVLGAGIPPSQWREGAGWDAYPVDGRCYMPLLKPGARDWCVESREP